MIRSSDPLLAANREAEQAGTLVIFKTKGDAVRATGRPDQRSRVFVELLRSRPNRFIAKDEIIEYIWGLEDGGPLAAAHTLDVYSCATRGLRYGSSKRPGIRLVLQAQTDRLARIIHEVA